MFLFDIVRFLRLSMIFNFQIFSYLFGQFNRLTSSWESQRKISFYIHRFFKHSTCEWVQIPDECYLHSQRVHKRQHHQLMKILHHGGNFHFQQVLMRRWLPHWFRHRQHRIQTINVRTNLIYVSHNWGCICARVFLFDGSIYI